MRSILRFFAPVWPLALASALLLLLAGFTSQAQAPGWQQLFTPGLNGASHVTGTAADATGSIYLVGYFNGSVSFGNTTLTSAGGTDIFVAKWRDNNIEWAQRAGGTGNELAAAIGVTAAQVYIVGTFSGTASFGSTSLVSNGGTDIFVAKLLDAGNTAAFGWSQCIGGSGNELIGNVLAVSGTSVYVTGSYRNTVRFGNSTLTLPNASTNSLDVFVTRLTDTGLSSTFDWAQRAGGPDTEEVQAIAINGANVYIAGSFFGTSVQFGTTTLRNAGLAGTNDMFIAKLTDTGSSGDFVWAQRVGGASTEYGHALAVSGATIYLLGEFGSTSVAFGSTTLLNASSNNSGTDVFIGKLTDNGPGVTFGWAQRAGGQDFDTALAMVLQGTSLYLAGFFFDTTIFGATTLTNSSVAGADIVVAKLTDEGTTSSFAWAQAAGGASDYYDEAYCITAVGSTIYVGGEVEPPAAFGSLAATGTPNQALGFLASFTDPAVATPLPVQLAAFQIVLSQESEAILRWSTATELTSAYFAVERSLDGQTYAEVTRVAAAGTSGRPHTYEWQDPRLLTGLIYYRLRQVDVDGTTHYSPVRTIMGAPARLAVFPNPAHAAFKVVGARASTTVHVVNMLNQEVLTSHTDGAGSATLALPAGLPSGMYLLRVANQITRFAVE